MVKAVRKPLEEIMEMVRPYARILTVGCGGCTSVCLAGGQREVLALNEELSTLLRQEGRGASLAAFTMERQCSPDFLSDAEDPARECDCLLSLACGVGVQGLAEKHADKPVFPALDTVFVGHDRDVAWFEERCRTCGTCALGWTGGICPVARCAKSLWNGPCGGVHPDESCEVGEVPCAWNLIYRRLKEQGRLASILAYRPPMRWIDKGPAAFVQRGYEGRYPGRGGKT